MSSPHRQPHTIFVILRQNIGPLLALCAFFTFFSLYAAAALLVHDSASYAFFPPFVPHLLPYEIHHLGGENHSIATALLAGRGFSDPFRVPTGPTAWMPPVIPFILAVLIKIFGTGLALTTVVAIFQDLIWIGAGFAIFIVARESARRTTPWAVLAAYALMILALFRWFFQTNHDPPFVMATLFALWAMGVSALRNDCRHVRGLWWGVLGGFCALVAPVTAVVWTAATGFLLRTRRLRVRAALIAAAFFVATLLPWTYRNYVVFGEIIPIKSNIFFDIYFSTEVVPTGIPTEGIFRKHPYIEVAKEGISEYERLGEQEFLRDYRARAIALLHQRPGLFLKKALQRLLAMTVRYQPYNEVREKYTKWFSAFVWWLPFAALVLTMTMKSVFTPAEQQLQRFTALLYCAYLLPYVLVTYYVRYSIPLTAFAGLFIFWGVEGLMRWRNQRQSTAAITPPQKLEK